MKQGHKGHIERKKLVDHISRLEGQLASVKAELAKERPDCTKASTTLRAASRSFASLRHAFVTCFLSETFVERENRRGRESEYEALLHVIGS